jgi:hypothetical protein
MGKLQHAFGHLHSFTWDGCPKPKGRAATMLLRSVIKDAVNVNFGAVPEVF